MPETDYRSTPEYRRAYKRARLYRRLRLAGVSLAIAVLAGVVTLLLARCGYTEAEMQVHRDHELMLEEALKRLEGHFETCEQAAINLAGPPPAPAQTDQQTQ
jgi:hypothetical protein